MQRKILPLLLFSLLALTGCSCQQRLERLRRQCPDCFKQTTAHVRDTLTIPEKILTGSVPWAWLPSGDTILFQNRDITLQLLLEGDSLRADVTVQPDTIPVDHEVILPCPNATTAGAACTPTWPWPPHCWPCFSFGASPAKCASPAANNTLSRSSACRPAWSWTRSD